MRRRKVLALVAGAIIGATMAATPRVSPARTAGGIDISTAMRILAEEKTLAANGARMLERFGKDDVANYALGINLYAEAEAAFDGLIEQLKTELALGRAPGGSPDFKAALERAVRKREAFVNFVQSDIVPKAAGHRNPWPAVIAGAEGLLKALTEAGTKVWQGYRDADAAGRAQVTGQLEAQKWPSYDQAIKG